MKRLKHNILQDLIYAIIWLVVFVVPVFVYSYSGTVYWEPVFNFWVRILPFFVLFLLNNYLFVPRLLLLKRWGWYFGSVLAAVFLFFSVIQPAVVRTGRFGPGEREIIEMRQRMDSLFGPAWMRTADDMPRMRDGSGRRPDSLSAAFPPGRIRRYILPGEGEFGRKPPGKDVFPGGPVLRMPVRMSMMLNDWLVAILIVGFNIAIYYLFKSIRDERQIRELEAHTLQAELNYLKAQINPHFFMNTLNNIHALVDINSEKAKDTVIELSKIMRYVLYEADQQGIQLSREIQFIGNYVSLMRIRFSDEIDIRMDFADPVPDVKIPPMLLVTLIENAFKHGISYRRDSFIHTSLTVEDGFLAFSVENSLSEAASGKPGVGMENMQKRLNLLYGDNYTLETKQTLEKYRVTLIIPVS